MSKINRKILGIMLVLFIHQNIMSAYTLQPILDSVVTTCQQNPCTTTLVAIGALYCTAYGLTQMSSKNKKIEVLLVDSLEQPADKANYLFAHGIAETHEQAYWYTKGKSNLPHIIDGRVFTYDYPDTTQHFWRVNFTQTGLGQQNEIMGLKSAYEQALAKLAAEHKPQKFVLVGMSRGATTIVNFLGQYKPEHIQAAVVESPFDSTHSITKNILSKVYLDKIPGMQTIAHGIMSVLFWQHDTAGSHAIDAVVSIDKDLPMLLVCSKQDKLVPVESTVALYTALTDSGHTKAHIFIADNGRHGRLLHDADGHKYQQVVHAFYKKYGLPHDPEIAALGQSLLEQSQPKL